MSRLDTYQFRSRNTIERHDAHDGSRVTYQFPMSWQIQADRNGVSFQGSSVNYDSGTLIEVEQAIVWAKQIHVALKNGQGICPQRECEGRMVMRSNAKGWAWWEGKYKEKMKDMNGVSAAAILRKMAREEELAYEEAKKKA